MNSQPSTVLQNTTNTYSDGSTLHAFFQRHKRPSDDGMTGSPNKRPRIEVTADSQEAESQTSAEDVVEEVRVPRTNTFKMLRNMYRSRNTLTQPSSTCPGSGGAVGRSLRSPLVPTNRVLESFVSSEKADTFHCHSVRDGVSISPPYTCAFSNGKGRHCTEVTVLTEIASRFEMWKELFISRRGRRRCSPHTEHHQAGRLGLWYGPPQLLVFLRLPSAQNHNGPCLTLTAMLYLT